MVPLIAQVDLAHSLTAVTSDSGIDINQLAHLSQGNPIMLVVLAGVAVLGGKKVWEFWQKRQELQHEQRMEEIKSQAPAIGVGHEECVAKQQALEASVHSLKSKIADLENKTSTAEKSAGEIKTSSEQALQTVEDELKKVRKKVKKLEEKLEQAGKKTAKDK